jgi:hypothetical protein
MKWHEEELPLTEEQVLFGVRQAKRARNLNADDVVRMLRQCCRNAGSQLRWAEANGISAQYVCDVLKSRREPGESILDALELEKVVTYRMKS